MAKIKVLIVDDSAVMRRLLSDMLSASPYVEVVGTALDPYIAANKISKLQPDVLTLDIEMPRMDGLTFLSKLMKVQPMPVVMVSSLTEKGASQTIRALQLGAVDFICKPSLDSDEQVKIFQEQLVEKVTGASSSKPRRSSVAKLNIDEKYSADAVLKKKAAITFSHRTEKIIAIGASTGGTEVIENILINLDENTPGIVIAQHMPEKFTEAFANRVNGLSPLLVKEGTQGDRVFKGTAFIAPGGKHMLLNADSKGYFIEINTGPAVNRHKPSVDVLYRSVSQIAGKSAAGIICTGMGGDGAKGLLEMKEAGSQTVAQDENSCIVYGMPREAVNLGAAERTLNIEGIIQFIKSIKG